MWREARKIKEDPVFKTDFNPFESPTLIGEAMVFGNLDGHLYCFDSKNARLLWAVNVGRRIPYDISEYHALFN